ncbi:MAG: hypothetical protein KAU20_05510 [Nanoarchaeota archaeon]|nr:hypothetical protein [Nanoarchaeota archaeon]
MDFTEAEQKIIAQIEEDDKYLNYLARLYYEKRFFDEVADYLKVDKGFFSRLFSAYPEIEERIDQEVAGISDKDAIRTNNLALPDGLNIVADIMNNRETKDKRILLQAAALHLQFYLKRKEKKQSSADDDLDILFRKMQKEQDEKS